MHRSARINPLSALGLVFACLSSACFGDKVLSEAGGGGAGATAVVTSAGGDPMTGGGGSSSADGGSQGGNGGDGGGGAPATTCTPANEGMACDGGQACATFTCIASECTFMAFLPINASVGDNAQAGDCIGLFCTGQSADPVQGQTDDPPIAQAECFTGTCSQGVPTQTPHQKGTACPTGVCSGADLGCVECISWANCAAGQVCHLQSGTCGSCGSGVDCAGNPAGGRCEGGVCGCIVGSDCQTSPAGSSCNLNGDCGCGSSPGGACDNEVDFGEICSLVTDECGCQGPNDCGASALGKACVIGRCGCNGDADCEGQAVCDVTASVCVSP